MDLWGALHDAMRRRRNPRISSADLDRLIAGGSPGPGQDGLAALLDAAKAPASARGAGRRTSSGGRVRGGVSRCRADRNAEEEKPCTHTVARQGGHDEGGGRSGRSGGRRDRGRGGDGLSSARRAAPRAQLVLRAGRAAAGTGIAAVRYAVRRPRSRRPALPPRRPRTASPCPSPGPDGPVPDAPQGARSVPRLAGRERQEARQADDGRGPPRACRDGRRRVRHSRLLRPVPCRVLGRPRAPASRHPQPGRLPETAGPGDGNGNGPGTGTASGPATATAARRAATSGKPGGNNTANAVVDGRAGPHE